MAEEGYAVIPRAIQRDKTITGNAKLVYLALSSRANAHGQCWPSVRTIADDASMSENTARTALKELRARNLVHWTPMPAREDGGQSSNLYTLGPATVAPTPLQDLHRGGAAAAPAPLHDLRTNEHHLERTPLEVTPPAPQGGQQLALLDDVEAEASEDLFEQAWKHWPRKESKKTARERFRRITRRGNGTRSAIAAQMLAEAITAHGDAYRAWPEQEQQAVPYLASWLNAERWDEPLPQPRAARGTHPGILDIAAEAHRLLQPQQTEEDPWTPRKLTR